MSQILKDIATELRQRTPELKKFRVTAGFDGFVDEIIRVVSERRGLNDWQPVRDIDTFGSLIKAASGRSSLREIVIDRYDAGGCTVNLGDGIAELGVSLDAYATLGEPRHPAFREFAAKCHSCVSWGTQYGRTLAMEFADGKFMLSAVTQLQEMSPALLEQVLADGAYEKSCRDSQLIVLTNWTLYPHMTACWDVLVEKVYSRLTHRPWFYFDLVDPSGRALDDVKDMLKVLVKFEKHGRTTLGVNGNEANIISRALSLPTVDSAEDMEGIKKQAVAIREKLGISEVATHCIKLAAVADTSGVVGVQGPFCPSPKKSTGAGDRFNAGYCLGQIMGFAPEKRLLLACATSGFFVRNARSGNPAELVSFLENWANGRLE